MNSFIIRKRPQLKFNILEHLAIYGKLSKSGLSRELKNHHYPDIHYAIEGLRDAGYIQIVGKRQLRGKAEIFYTITEKGIIILMEDINTPPLKFWKILLGTCQQSRHPVTYEKINEFYNIFIKRYLKYPKRGFSLQLTTFNMIQKFWLQKYIQARKRDTKLQELIEQLAINPRLTLDELAAQIEVRKLDVKTILSNYSAALTTGYESTDYNSEYVEFILKNTIIVRKNEKRELTYELSLYGVLLVLVLIGSKDLRKFDREHSHYNRFSAAEYYDKIARNYRRGLPLIFGKWKLLTTVMGNRAISNFQDILLAEETLDSDKSRLSITTGGNKEMLDGIREIIEYNYYSMRELAYAGIETLERDYPKILEREISELMEKEDYIQKCDPLFLGLYSSVYSKLAEVLSMLRPSFQFNFHPNLLKLIREPYHHLRRMEEYFADEITATYYMRLYSDGQKSGQQFLHSIFEKDEKLPWIEEFYHQWKQDIRGHHEAICRALS